MSLSGAKVIKILDWLGLQSFASDKNLPFGWWKASNNVIITNDGSAEVLRSPKNFNNALVTTNPLQSAFDADFNSGNLILIDALASSSVATWSTSGTTNLIVRTGQANARWKRLMVNDKAYGLNGTEFIQITSTGLVYAIGISSPATAPALAFAVGGASTLTVGVTASYAYRNSVSTHISQPSPASISSGTSASNTLRIPVTASAQTGVDNIVLFITEDGGSVRYLYTDANGNAVIHANSTMNIDISIALLTNLDTLTPETAYNSIPPTNAFFMFRWKDRICLCDFRGDLTRQQVQFNSYETVFYGQPWESWWPLNIINIPNKGDAARAGIETEVGALVLAENDAYLIRGELSDKVSGPESPVSITEHLQPLKWSIGTRSPYSLVSTPFGEIWLDQNKRIQLWNRAGYPNEAGLPIRTSLNAILDTDAARNMAEGKWFQHGKNGGVYVLTASTSGSANNQLFILTIYKDPEKGDLRFGAAVSDITAQCLVVADVSGRMRLYAGVTDRLRELMDPDVAGAGWSATQTRSFNTVVGNEDTFSYFHSVKFDASSIVGLTVAVSNLDGTNSQNVELDQDTGSGGAYYGVLDSYGYRKLVTFTFSADDTTLRQVQNLEVRYSPKRRLL